jgi:hypothetical protein
MRGCPVRWHAGPDRPCADHCNEILSAAAELGIDLGIPGRYPLPGGSDGCETLAGDAPDSPHTHT